MLRTIYQSMRSVFSVALLGLVLSATFVVMTQQQALAQSGSIYPGGAAEVPDWLLEGKAGPPEYLAAQAEWDARTARAQMYAARPDGWRYVRHAGRWWYYQAINQWLVRENNAWKPYSAPVVATNRPSIASSVKPVNNVSVGK